jgi:hypothetical protein
MSRGPWLTSEQRTVIEEGVINGDSSPAIQRKLEEKNMGVDVRTVQREVKKLRPPDASGAWSFADIAAPVTPPTTAEEARLILPVLAAVLEQPAGDSAAISRDLAAWIVRIRTAAPTLPPQHAYGYAILYRAAAAHKRDTRELDRRLARLEPPAQIIDVPTATATAGALPPTIQIRPQLPDDSS